MGWGCGHRGGNGARVEQEIEGRTGSRHFKEKGFKEERGKVERVLSGLN